MILIYLTLSASGALAKQTEFDLLIFLFRAGEDHIIIKSEYGTSVFMQLTAGCDQKKVSCSMKA